MGNQGQAMGSQDETADTDKLMQHLQDGTAIGAGLDYADLVVMAHAVVHFGHCFANSLDHDGRTPGFEEYATMMQISALSDRLVDLVEQLSGKTEMGN